MLIITQITQNHPIKNLDVGHQSFLELPQTVNQEPTSTVFQIILIFFQFT